MTDNEVTFHLDKAWSFFQRCGLEVKKYQDNMTTRGYKPKEFVLSAD